MTTSFRLCFEKLTSPAQNHAQDEKNYRRQYWIRNRYGNSNTRLIRRLGLNRLGRYHPCTFTVQYGTLQSVPEDQWVVPLQLAAVFRFVASSVMSICQHCSHHARNAQRHGFRNRPDFQYFRGGLCELTQSITDVWNCPQAEFFRLVTSLLPINPLKFVGKTGSNFGICSNWW